MDWIVAQDLWVISLDPKAVWSKATVLPGQFSEGGEHVVCWNRRTIWYPLASRELKVLGTHQPWSRQCLKSVLDPLYFFLKNRKWSPEGFSTGESEEGVCLLCPYPALSLTQTWGSLCVFFYFFSFFFFYYFGRLFGMSGS